MFFILFFYFTYIRKKVLQLWPLFMIYRKKPNEPLLYKQAILVDGLHDKFSSLFFFSRGRVTGVTFPKMQRNARAEKHFSSGCTSQPLSGTDAYLLFMRE